MSFRKRVAMLAAGAAAGLMLAGAGAAQAQQGPHNWYYWHHYYSAHCVTQADSYGRWGQVRTYDSWCGSNVRYRAVMPDRTWRTQNNWDHGGQGDHQH